jgi:uncharacterized protein (DUF1697 family)
LRRRWDAVARELWQHPSVSTWIAFLRAVNIGRRQFPKNDIIDAVAAGGGRDIATYIQTGNVRLTHDSDDRTEVELALEKAFLADRGFDVPTICVTPRELREIADVAVAFAHPGRHYVSLLKDVPAAAAITQLRAKSGPGEAVEVVGRGVHLLLGENYHEATLTNAVVERHLGVATNRNLAVVTKLADMWGA